MKIIHCADIHADSKMGTHFSKEEAAERRNDIVDTFASMVKFGKNNNVKIVIIAGDFFDAKTAQQKTIKKRIAYIIGQNSDIDFLYLRGNHDEDVDFAIEDGLQNLKRFSKDTWKNYRYNNVVITGREFSSNIPASVYSELRLDTKDVNIVTLHGQVADYKAKDGAPVISMPKLANQNIDYIALGHIHDYNEEKLDKRCKWSYAGCLEGRGFDECGQKGFVLLDIDNNKVESKFISIAKRQIHEVYVELSGSISYSEIMNLIKEKVTEIPNNDIVQVVLSGGISEDTEIELESYQKALAKDFYFVRLKDRTEPQIDFEKYVKDVSLKGEFIRMVNDKTDISKDEKAKIIMTGIKALAGRLE